MKVCPYCHKDLPDDAEFCTYCGRSLVKKTETKKEKEEVHLKKNPRENSWAKLGLLLFFIGLVGCDFGLSLVLESAGGNAAWAYRISMVIYVLAFLCGLASLLVDRRDQKNGYEPKGNKGYAYASMALSFYIFMINLTQGVL